MTYTTFSADCTYPTLLYSTGLYPENIQALSQDIEHIARYFVGRTTYTQVDVQDLAQEGMIGAWEASQRLDHSRSASEQKSYCLRGARNNMVNYLNQLRKQTTLDESLEAYLHDEETGIERCIEDVPPPQTHKVQHNKKCQVNQLLATLPAKHRLVVMSAYQIQAHRGTVPSKSHVCRVYKLTPTQYQDTKRRAIAMLYRNNYRMTTPIV